MDEQVPGRWLIHGGGVAVAILVAAIPVAAAQDGTPVNAGETRAPAVPADPLVEAKAAFNAAAEAAARGDYAAALGLMQKAYELSRHPWLLFNLGSLHEKLGECRAAIAAFEAYLAAVPNGNRLEQARASIAALEPACVETSEPAPAVESVDPPPPVELDRRSVPRGPELAKPPTGKPAEKEAQAPGRVEKTVGAAALVGGALAAGAAVYFAWSAKDHADSMDAQTAHARSLPDDERPTWSATTMAAMERAREEDQTRALIFGGLSTILIGSGVVLLLMPSSGSNEARPDATSVPSRLRFGIGSGRTVVGTWSTAF